ncbi:MAG: inositol monophosphatase family protein [Mycobacteriaceae bacterium]
MVETFTEDVDGLLHVVGELLSAIEGRFIAGLGAPSALAKGTDDFATAVDLELEQTLTTELSKRTGFAVHGEEYGGPPADQGTVWVIDPVDGTFNYSAGSPLAGILVGLLHNGIPVAGFTWLPLLNQRYAASVNGPVLCNGKQLPRLSAGKLTDSIVALGGLNIDSQGQYPGRFRLAALGAISRVSSRIRMHGATGIDLAFASAGVIGCAVSFGHQIWDHAAGVALAQAGGAVVSDLRGNSWKWNSESAVVGAPGVHGEVIEIIAALGDPASYLES